MAGKLWRENYGGKIMAGKLWRENMAGKVGSKKLDPLSHLNKNVPFCLFDFYCFLTKAC
jgi:hypothetical protein